VTGPRRLEFWPDYEGALLHDGAARVRLAVLPLPSDLIDRASRWVAAYDDASVSGPDADEGWLAEGRLLFAVLRDALAIHRILVYDWEGIWDEDTSPTDSQPMEKGVAMTSSTDQNKAVVRRFITEVLAGGNLELVDELLAANYVNRGMGDTDRAGFKAMLAAMGLGPLDRRMEIKDLVAEGNAVVARFSFDMTLPSGEKITVRGMTYYELADGRIVEDDPITSPDVTQMLAQAVPPTGP
jgi:ketosteroid isomerase-like protein